MCVSGAYAQEPSNAAEFAANDAASAKSMNIQTLGADIAAYVGHAQVNLPGEQLAKSVADRLLNGFQQSPPRHLKLANGAAIYWGWQEGQAFIQSIAVYDAKGSIAVLGAVDNVPRLYHWRSRNGVVDQQEYRALLQKYSRWGSQPSVVLFAREESNLETYLPLILRWLQAAMMGFNVDCSDAQTAPSCTFAEQVVLPTAAYSLNCETGNTVNHCPLHLPDIQASTIPLKLFRQ